MVESSLAKIKSFFVTVFVFTFWKMVWWWKHQTGFMDLGKDVTVEGVVVWTDYGKNPDGDFTFNLKMDAAFAWANNAFGRQTSEDPANYPDTIHCEIPPWGRSALAQGLAQIRPGARVRVTGRWGFDGVHTGRSEFVEVLYALWRHQPNVGQGWCEIHPVTAIEFLP